MEWIHELIFGSGIAHSILLLSLVIAMGIALGKVKIAGISLGVTWILFVGIAASHFGMVLDEKVLNFVKDFGLVLFIFAVGIQVGPGFFASFKKKGLTLNGLAALGVVLGVAVTLILWKVTGVNLTTMVGILSGAVTNTPGLGAAQEAYRDATGISDPTISMGYAVTYPLGVVGIIGSILLMRKFFGVNLEEENRKMEQARECDPMATSKASVKVLNSEVIGKKILELRGMCESKFVISRVMHLNGSVILAESQTEIVAGDILYVVAAAKDLEAVTAFIGEQVEIGDEQWHQENGKYVSRRIVITKSQFNGRYLGDLKLRTNFGVNVTRVNRAGVDLVANANLMLQMGDRLTVIGDEMALNDVAKMLGNSLKRLREPNVIVIFVGLLLGVIIGSIPFVFGGISQPVKLGLAGGSLIIALLIGRFGPRMRMVTYTTVSANLMLREIGIALFLAAVGLGAGQGFVDTIVNKGGWMWIGYGFIITVVPILIVGFIAKKWCKIDYFTIMGLIAGGNTDPFALSFATSMSPNDQPAVGYTTVYPLTMFLRVISAQILILLAV